MKINSLSIFLTRRCNYRCQYCSTNTGQDPEDKLTLDELEDIVLQAKSLGAKWLIIPGQGEPFLDENLFPLLDFAVDQGLRTKIFTNGSLINRETAIELYKKKVAIVYKLHALDKSLYDSLAGKKHATVWIPYCVDPAINEIVQIPAGLKWLIDVGYTQKKWSLFESLLQIEVVVLQQNIEQVKSVAQFCRKLGIDLAPETLIQTPCVTKTMAVTYQQERRLFDELRQILGFHLVVQQWKRCRFETNPCLDISGNIRHCCSLPAKELGNIRSVSLKGLHSRELRCRKRNRMISPLFSFSHHGFRLCATRRYLNART